MDTLVLDCNALCHKVKHSLGELTHETEQVGVIFGFFIQLLKLAKTYESNDFVFTWDSSKSHRAKIYPPYKEKRRTTKAEKTFEDQERDRLAYEQFEKLYTQILPSLGFRNNFKVEGYEGDDLIASVVNNNTGKFIIVSGDEDMYQCLSENVSIVNGKGMFTANDFVNVFGIEPKDWVRVKAMAGCTSDEIAGIKGIGETKAIQFLKGQISPHLKSYLAIQCQEGKEITKRNLELVSLPFKGCPEIHLAKNNLDFDAFMRMCTELNFQSFLKKDELAKWKKYIFNTGLLGVI